MKFTIKIMKATSPQIVLEGDLLAGMTKDRYGSDMETCNNEELRQAAFAIERAINQQTDFRCHVFEG